jgi:hypothetical protein
MPQQAMQTRENHARIDPAFHYFVVPALLVVLIARAIHLVRHPGVGNGVMLLLVTAVLVLAFKARMYALKAQDRVIRLEERLRIQALCPEISGAQLMQLRENQLIALRFASDGDYRGWHKLRSPRT